MTQSPKPAEMTADLIDQIMYATRNQNETVDDKTVRLRLNSILRRLTPAPGPRCPKCGDRDLEFYQDHTHVGCKNGHLFENLYKLADFAQFFRPAANVDVDGLAEKTMEACFDAINAGASVKATVAAVLRRELRLEGK